MLTPAHDAAIGETEQQMAVMLPLTPAGGDTPSPPAAHSPGFSDMGVRSPHQRDQYDSRICASAQLHGSRRWNDALSAAHPSQPAQSHRHIVPQQVALAAARSLVAWTSADP